MSSYIGALTHQNRPIRVTGTSTATANGTQNIYVTLPLWPSHALLNRVQVTANNTFSNLTVTILTDGAQFRGASQPGLWEQAVSVSAASGVSTVSADFTGTYIEDHNRVGCLYICLSSSAPFTNGTIFTVFADGIETLPTSSREEEIVPWSGDRGFRVLLLPNGASNALDLTQNSLMNGNPYVLGSTNLNLPFNTLNSALDALYIGMSKPFTRFYVTVPVYPAPQPTGNTLAATYWNGTTWATATVLDNTSDGQDTTPSTFSYSGVMNVTASGWQTHGLSFDPLSSLAANITAGNQVPIGFINDFPRYWLKLTVANGTYPVQITSLRPMK